MYISKSHWTVQGVAAAIADGSDTIDINELAGAVNTMAFRAAEADVKAEIRGGFASTAEGAARTEDATEEQFRDHLMRVALRSADDAWSGRRNDVRRSYADGRRETVQSLLDDLKFGGVEGLRKAVGA